MSDMFGWGRRIRAAQASTDRVAREMAEHEKALERTLDRVQVASRITERAAVDLLDSQNNYFRAAAR